MFTMEFDEIKKIWDAQNSQMLYAVNEEALHKRILTKKNQARHIANTSELLSILVNVIGGGVVLEKSLASNSDVVSMYVLSGWMLIVGLCCLVSRLRRLRERKRFDRSMKGELEHALTDATYQVRLSRILRWNVFPIGVLLLMALLQVGKPLWVGGLVLLAVVVLFYISGFEDNFYKKRKRELETLYTKLESETTDTLQRS